MKIKAIGLGIAFALMVSANPASASIVLDSDATGGWSNGTGTSNGHFTLDQEANGVEVGLRAGIRGGGGGPITPNAGTNIYDAPAGTSGIRALWNIEYTINTGSIEGLIAQLTISDGNGHTVSLNPLTDIGDNTTNSSGAKQNSENLTFAFLGGPLSFDPNAPGTYTFDLTLEAPNAASPLASVETIVQVAAVPEPATWAMMLLGFAGIAFAGYRNSRKAAEIFAV